MDEMVIQIFLASAELLEISREYFLNYSFNSFWKENSWYRAKTSPEYVLISCAQTLSYPRTFEIWSGNRATDIFKFETARKVGS